MCKYIRQSFFFMNETLCYNAIAIAYRTIHGLKLELKYKGNESGVCVCRYI